MTVLQRDDRFEELSLEYDEVLNSIYSELKELNEYTDNEFESDFEMLLAFEKCAIEVLPKDYPILQDYYIRRWYNNSINELDTDFTLTHRFHLTMNKLEDKHYYMFRFFEFMGYTGISLILSYIWLFIILYIFIL